MSSNSARKKQRLSPEIAATPNATARTEPITPFRRAISAGPTPGSQRTPAFRTPGTAASAVRVLVAQIRSGAPCTAPQLQAVDHRVVQRASS